MTEAQRERKRKANKEWAKKNPEKVLAAQRRWRKKNWAKILPKQLERNRRWRATNPEKRAAQHARNYRKHRNGRRLPGGLCEMCGQEETALARRSTGEIRALHQDHCHATGVQRGLICLDCNRGLAAFKDNPELLRKAAAYIESYVRS